jgi:hypothetical protein
VSIRNWRDWFVPEGDVEPAHVTNDEADIASGARHKDFDKLVLVRKQPPRCAKCKRFMGFEDGMYIIISGDWRIHIHCFGEVLERHFEDGEVIDLTTGNIVQIEIGVD